jgi:hypothetical protein
MRRSLLAVGSVILLAACHGNSAMMSADGAGTSPPDLATTAPAGSVTASIGPISLASGDEVVVCTTQRLSNTTDIDVVKISTALQPGSHHLVLYKSDATVEQTTPQSCTSFDGIMKGEQPLFIAESASSTMQLPSEAAYHLPAGQMVRLEAHYLNTTKSTLMGMGTVVLEPGAPGKSYQPAGLMFCGSVFPLYSPGLPPNTKTTLPVGFYKGGAGVDLTTLKIFAFTSHEHHLGSDVKVWKGTSANKTATQLYDNPSWDNPPLQSYDDSNLLTFGAGEGIAWQCGYDTTGQTQTTFFGESAATNEMCFIWAYYYPYVGRFISMNDCWQ